MDEDGMLRADIRSDRKRRVSDQQHRSRQSVRYGGTRRGYEEDGECRQYEAYDSFQRYGRFQCSGYYEEYHAVCSLNHEYECPTGTELLRRRTGAGERERRFRYHYRPE